MALRASLSSDGFRSAQPTCSGCLRGPGGPAMTASDAVDFESGPRASRPHAVGTAAVPLNSVQAALVSLTPIPPTSAEVGWVEQRETHRSAPVADSDGFRSAQPILRADGWVAPLYHL